MQALPPKCRASLHNLGSAVVGKVTRSKGTKPAKTRLARQEHFLAYCHSMHFDNLCTDLPQPVSQNYLPAMPSPSSKGIPSPEPPSNPAPSKTTSKRRLTFSLPQVSKHHIPEKLTLSTSSCAHFRTLNQYPNVATWLQTKWPCGWLSTSPPWLQPGVQDTHVRIKIFQHLANFMLCRRHITTFPTKVLNTLKFVVSQGWLRLKSLLINAYFALYW